VSTVLLCEDEPLTRQCLADFLESKEFLVKTAPDGSKALELLETQSVDIIISDLNMKPMDGITLLERLRKESSQVPFILITGQPNIDSFLKATHDLGAFEYIQKPFDFNMLIAIINKLIESS